MVDAIRAEIGRTQHVRAALKPRAHPALLAMAANACDDLADREPADRHGDTWAVACRLADPVHQHIPGQSLRTVRAASDHQQPLWPTDAGAALPHAAVLQGCAAPALSRLHHRVLVDPDDDG